MIDYQGRTALVTGGGSGIGRALAQGLAARGAQVIVADRNLEGAEETARGIGAGAHALGCDLADPGSPERLIAAASDLCGPLHLVCSNAGVGRNRRVLRETFDAAAMQLMEVNLFAGFRLAQAYMRALEAGGGRGRILLTGSENSLSVPDAVKTFGLGLYGASKHGLLIMAEWLKGELRDKPLEVHVLLPGGVYTPLVAEGLPEFAKIPPELNIILPERCADLALKGMDLGLFYIPTHAHIEDDMRPRVEGVAHSLRALGLKPEAGGRP